ncbi:MAG: hypothetical protein J7M25_16790 [Deltaproteobacteria bacterium]|nr:hypothetical protein [Deltaproteobacteria bacterium]
MEATAGPTRRDRSLVQRIMELFNARCAAAVPLGLVLTATLVLVVGVGWLASGCNGSKDANQSNHNTTTRKVPFDTWRDLRQAIRSSPDHLVARADDVVARKDPEAIFAFVRDEISARPVRADGFGPGEAVAVRWAPETTLRYGVGTPREKVELLADLYRRAGFDAEVWAGANALTQQQTRACFALKPRPDFAPSSEDVAIMKQLQSELGVDTASRSVSFVDEGGDDSNALAEKVLAILPQGLEAKKSVDLSSFDTMLLVRVMVDGNEIFANPLPPDAVFGESYASDNLGPAPDPVTVDDTVHVELSVARSDDPNSPKVLVQGDWSLSDLVGRRLRVEFVPAVDLDSLSGLTIESVRSFFAVLALDAPGVEPAALAEQSVAASSAITLSGQEVAVDDAGTVSVDGVPVATGEPNPALLAQVASIDVDADPVAFPRVVLRAVAKDDQGNLVTGLGASAFHVTDEEHAGSFVMERNASSGPRIVILVDLSDSIPQAFRDDVANYAHDLAASILQHHPDAMFRVAAVGLGAESAGDFTASPDEVKTQAAAASGVGSDLWAALSAADDLGGTVIVFTTDGDADSPSTVDQKLRIEHGPPVVMIGVGTVVQTTLDEMASLSGGTVTTATQPSDAADAANAFLDQKAVDPYVLAYRAGQPGVALHHVVVSTSDGRVEGRATYTIPASDARIPTPALIGLYLTIQVGATTVTRTLAGYDKGLESTPSDEDATAVEEMMFGTTLLSFEGSDPTMSAILDDALVSKLRIEPLWDAAVSGDVDQIRSALTSPIPAVVPALNSIAVHLDSEDATQPIYETGPRVVLFTERPKFDTGIVRRMDILPLGGFATLAEDPKVGFRRTLVATARFAVMEQALFVTSTMSLLADADLALLSPYDDIGEVAPGLDSAAKDRWGHVMDPYWDEYRIVPKTGSPMAFYAVDPDTGRLIAVLPDGSGGGSETQEMQDRINRASQLMDLLGLLASLTGGGFGLGGFIALQKAILKSILREALAVTLLDGTGLQKDLEQNAKDAACDLAKGGLGEKFSKFSDLNDADTAVGVADGKGGLLSCPW